MWAPRYWMVATTSRSWCLRSSSRMSSMIGRPPTGTRGLGRWLVSGRSREPSPPAITTARIPTILGVTSVDVASELGALALDLTWTWEPRIQRFFEVLEPALWRETPHNPVVLLNRLGAEGVERALERPEVKDALQ